MRDVTDTGIKNGTDEVLATARRLKRRRLTCAVLAEFLRLLISARPDAARLLIRSFFYAGVNILLHVDRTTGEKFFQKRKILFVGSDDDSADAPGAKSNQTIILEIFQAFPGNAMAHQELV